MSNQNKVEFGLEELHIGSYTVGADGTATLGEGVAVPGMVSLSLEEDSELMKFFADNVIYYSDFVDKGEEGDLTMALFPDELKVNYFGYTEMEDGAIAKIKGVMANPFWMAFQGLGDKNKRRHVLYNCLGGPIKRERKTLGENKEVETEVSTISVNGDNKTGVVKLSYSEGDTGYADALTQPTIPAVKTESP